LIDINGPFTGTNWHAHEMIFGYAVAVLTGFLFTAVKNWTGILTPTNWKLAALAVIWLSARILLITGPSLLASLVDLAFLPLMALGIGIPIWKSGNKRNIVVVTLVAVLFLANTIFHANAWELIEVDMELAFITGLNIFALFITLIAGRVMPMFINNSVPGARAGRIKPVEMGAMLAMVLIVVIDLARGLVPGLEDSSWFPLAYALFLLVVASLHGARLFRWHSHKTLKNPILWIMPLSYFWLAVSVALKALHFIWPELELIVSIHALSMGAIGGMMIGMMTRSALGHTGRAIHARWIETSCYWLIQLAVVSRLASFFIPTDYYMSTLILAALFWSSAFGLFAISYGPMLARPRADAIF
jgi:uncharacterized protein involved in response to NO